MKKYKIMHLIESASGWSLRYVSNICAHLEPHRWDTNVVYSRRPDSPHSFTDMFPEHVTLTEVHMQRDLSLMRDCKSAQEIKRIITTIQPDLIHLHSSKAGALGRLATIGTDIPVMYTPHGYASFRQDVSYPKRALYHWLEKVLDLLHPSWILVGSNREYECALKISSKNRVKLIPNAVEVPSAPLSNLLDTDLLYVTVGRLTAAKNPDGMLDIVEKVSKRLPQARFVWVGDGEQRHRLEEEAERRQVNITVTGWLTAERVKEILQTARVYVQPSSWEALPLAVLEAMALARPVVLSNIPAHQAIVRHAENGYLANSSDEFSDAIYSLLTDMDHGKQVGENAWKSMGGYRIEDFVISLIHFYRAVLGLEHDDYTISM